MKSRRVDLKSFFLSSLRLSLAVLAIVLLVFLSAGYRVVTARGDVIHE